MLVCTKNSWTDIEYTKKKDKERERERERETEREISLGRRMIRDFSKGSHFTDSPVVFEYL